MLFVQAPQDGVATIVGAGVSVVARERHPGHAPDSTIAALFPVAGVAVVTLDEADAAPQLGVARVGRARVPVVAVHRAPSLTASPNALVSTRAHRLLREVHVDIPMTLARLLIFELEHPREPRRRPQRLVLAVGRRSQLKWVDAASRRLLKLGDPVPVHLVQRRRAWRDIVVIPQVCHAGRLPRRLLALRAPGALASRPAPALTQIHPQIPAPAERARAAAKARHLKLPLKRRRSVLEHLEPRASHEAHPHLVLLVSAEEPGQPEAVPARASRVGYGVAHEEAGARFGAQDARAGRAVVAERLIRPRRMGATASARAHVIGARVLVVAVARSPSHARAVLAAILVGADVAVVTGHHDREVSAARRAVAHVLRT